MAVDCYKNEGFCKGLNMEKYFAKFSNIMRNNDINIYNSQELSEKFGLLSQLLIHIKSPRYIV